MLKFEGRCLIKENLGDDLSAFSNPLSTVPYDLLVSSEPVTEKQERKGYINATWIFN